MDVENCSAIPTHVQVVVVPFRILYFDDTFDRILIVYGILILDLLPECSLRPVHSGKGEAPEVAGYDSCSIQLRSTKKSTLLDLIL